MKIRLLSDLHTEFRLPYKTHPMSEYLGEDVLVLAGDIASGSTNTVNVIRHFKDLGFPHIVYVPGNHEYYGTDFDDFNHKMMQKCAQLDGVHFLNPGSVEIDGVLFVGATLWTNFGDNPFSQSAAKRGINDFRVIRAGQHNFTPQMAVDWHLKDKQFIKMMIEQFRQQGKKIVVVTHFMPSYECVQPKWKQNPGTDTLNWYFSAQCDDLLQMEGIKYWINGHTHDAYDMELHGTRIVCNPLGYPNENTFENKVINI